MPGKVFDVKQVQEHLHLSERTVFRLIDSGDLKGFKAGREWRFEESDIDDFIRRQREAAEKEAAEKKAKRKIGSSTYRKRKDNEVNGN